MISVMRQHFFFLQYMNRPMSVVGLLGKYLRDNQVYMPVLTILED